MPKRTRIPAIVTRADWQAENLEVKALERQEARLEFRRELAALEREELRIEKLEDEREVSP
jgi:hypothetical protein